MKIAHRIRFSCLQCALPLAAALLLPSPVLAATNLPSSDAGEIGATAPKDALHSSLPVTDAGVGSAAFRLVRIDVEQDGTQLDADELHRKAAHYTERTISETELNMLIEGLTAYARSHGYPAAAAYLPSQTNADGALTIRILAGRYGNITIENNAAISGRTPPCALSTMPVLTLTTRFG